MKQRIHLGLVLLLALLQGIAPLLHVHVGQDQPATAAPHFHSAAGAEYGARAQGDADASRRGAGAVIGIADEFRQDVALAVDHVALPVTGLPLASPLPGAVAARAGSRPIATARRFILPFAQAPPYLFQALTRPA